MLTLIKPTFINVGMTKGITGQVRDVDPVSFSLLIFTPKHHTSREQLQQIKNSKSKLSRTKPYFSLQIIFLIIEINLLKFIRHGILTVSIIWKNLN